MLRLPKWRVLVGSLFKILFAHFFFAKKSLKSAQARAPWFEKHLNMFENVFEVISDHMIHRVSLEDFPKAKKYNITKVRCQDRSRSGGKKGVPQHIFVNIFINTYPYVPAFLRAQSARLSSLLRYLNLCHRIHRKNFRNT